jgi:hypothetical protein
VDDCISAGRYCATDPDGVSGNLKGRDIVIESLR